MTKKIVFLDIDGTLVDYDGSIPPSAIATCREARRNGHLLYICSGRPRVIISDSVLSIGFDGVVSLGGAHIEAGGIEPGCNVIFHAAMPPETFGHIRAYFDAHEIGYAIEQADTVFAGPYFPDFLDRLRAQAKGTPEEITVNNRIDVFFRNMPPVKPDFYPVNVSKVVFMENRDLTFAEIKQEFDGECEVFGSSIPFSGKVDGGEIGPIGVHKGSAVERVIRHYGIPHENTIAIGDSDNDRKMIEYAAVGIAMDNADEALKKVADFITASVSDNGIARAFRKYGLI